ncbi:MAG: 3-phosphoshikimate 1-carboxyvinyltransferase [Nitrospirota bacterium]
MDRIELARAKRLKGKFSPPPDKSISHRAVIFSSLSQGQSVIRNFLRAEDTISTVNAMKMLGIEIQENVIPPFPPLEKGGKGGFSGELVINGKGLYGLKEPYNVIDCGNSGTTIRMLSGVLSGNSFLSVLTGDDSLRMRPMGRVIIPLTQMGAKILARGENKFPPVVVKGGSLKPIKYMMPVASAQVKSAILLAGLCAEGETEITEPFKSRDHTERMLSAFGAEIKVEGLKVSVRGVAELKGTEVQVPGDFSSAAFFIVGASLIENSDLDVKEVGINPTRTGLIEALREMGAQIEIVNVKVISGEPVADIRCTGTKELRAVTIEREKVPALIDEFPILCVAATQAEGITRIRGAQELRVKESDRIKAMTLELRKMGAEIEEFEDGLSIKGKTRLRGAALNSYGDHRIAMALSIAALIAEGQTFIESVDSVDVSFPGFFEILRKLTEQ